MMHSRWPLLLALTSISRAQNSTVLGAQATPTPFSLSAEASGDTVQVQGYGQPAGTCKTTSTVYEYGKPPTSTIHVTVTSPKTCPNPNPSTSIKTVTTTVTPSGGYVSLPPPITVTVTKSGGYGQPPVTVTETKNVTITKACLIS